MPIEIKREHTCIECGIFFTTSWYQAYCPTCRQTKSLTETLKRSQSKPAEQVVVYKNNDEEIVNIKNSVRRFQNEVRNTIEENEKNRSNELEQYSVSSRDAFSRGYDFLEYEYDIDNNEHSVKITVDPDEGTVVVTSDGPYKNSSLNKSFQKGILKSFNEIVDKKDIQCSPTFKSVFERDFEKNLTKSLTKKLRESEIDSHMHTITINYDNGRVKKSTPINNNKFYYYESPISVSITLKVDSKGQLSYYWDEKTLHTTKLYEIYGKVRKNVVDEFNADPEYGKAIIERIKQKNKDEKLAKVKEDEYQRKEKFRDFRWNCFYAVLFCCAITVFSLPFYYYFTNFFNWEMVKPIISNLIS